MGWILLNHLGLLDHRVHWLETLLRLKHLARSLEQGIIPWLERRVGVSWLRRLR